MASDYKKELEDLISIVIKEDASDLHLSEDRVPILRVSGFLIPLVKLANEFTPTAVFAFASTKDNAPLPIAVLPTELVILFKA